ncbi:MAG: cytochrome c nitrite reductase small subunit [Thermoanaerobaculia bacterium]
MKASYDHPGRRRAARRRGLALAETAAGLLLGTALGVGAYTFVYAKGASYLSNDPNACANCHVMTEQLDGWSRGSHRSVATCNDCHTPPGFVAKYATKASNGFWHSFAFTSGRFPDPIQITDRNHRVTEKACRKCHADVVHDIDRVTREGRELSCISCHRSVGHPH